MFPMYIRFVIDVRTLDGPFRDQGSHHKIDHSVLKARSCLSGESHVSNDVTRPVINSRVIGVCSAYGEGKICFHRTRDKLRDI